MTAPEPGWITEVDYVRTVDGDTIEVEVRRRFNIRIKDIDVYEKNTNLGKKAIDYVVQKFQQAKQIIVKIPTNDPIKLMDINSFERLLGEIYVDGKKLSTHLRQKGYEKIR